LSAPPPVRPMLVLALVSWYAWPFNGPVMTETVMVLFLRADGSMSEGNTPKGRMLWDESTVPTVGKQQAVSKRGSVSSASSDQFFIESPFLLLALLLRGFRGASLLARYMPSIVTTPSCPPFNRCGHTLI